MGPKRARLAAGITDNGCASAHAGRLHCTAWGAGIGAAGDDAEIGTRLLQRLRIDVGLFGRILDVGRLAARQDASAVKLLRQMQ
jgi:hypothetical protein